MMADLSTIIDAAGKQYNIDPALIQAVVQQESSGRPDAVNLDGGGQGAYGAMQVRQAALADFNKANGTSYTMKDLLKPDVGINVGSWYLGQQLDRFGDPTKALIAYNQGPNSDAVNAGSHPYASSVLGRIGGQKMLPGIPQPSDGPSDDDIFAAFTGGAKTTADDDAIFNAFIKPESDAKATTNTSGGVKESRGADGALVLEWGGVPAQDKSPVVAAIEKLGQFGRGAYQGLTDLPAGIGQNAAHQGQQTLAALDSILGTNLAAKAAPNVQALDADAAQREADYQAATPDSTMAGIGRVAGNLVPAFIGGPAAAAAPLETLSTGAGQLAARLGGGPIMQGLARLMGAGAGGALQGAAYGANTPVTSGDYREQAVTNARQGALIGGALPVVGAGTGYAGQKIGSGLRAMVDPFTEAGQQRIAQNTLARAAAGGPITADLSEIVPGSVPTLAEATGNAGIAKLQRTMRDVDPAPYVAREEANAAARLEVANAARGTAADLDAARAARAAQAADDYLQTNVGIPTSNTEYASLKKTPAFQAAYAQAEKMANNANTTLETKVANRANANRGGAIGKQETYISGTGLHRIKTALDDQISTASRAGENAKAANILGVKEKLLQLMDREIPGYAAARSTYAQSSAPIDAMQYLQSLGLTDMRGNITLGKINGALEAIKREVGKPGNRLAKSVSDEQIQALTKIRDDLLRADDLGKGISKGSPTAQNLATQNMLSQMLPGKLGALAGKASPGTIGGGVGGLAGWMAAGPAGAAVGGVVGSQLGKVFSGAMNAQNEAIQGALQRMLLNAGEGAAALQRAPALSAPATQIGGVQRLLYPALTVTGLGALSRPAPTR